MTDDRPSDLLSALPRSRPHRRSNKRPERAPKSEAPKAVKAHPRATAGKPASSAAAPAPRKRARSLPQPAQPRGVPRAARPPRPEPTTEFPLLRTAVQAAAELAEIGFTLSAKALRGAAGRLPRP